MKLKEPAPTSKVEGGFPLARALNAADLAAAASCFSAEACLITPDATAVHGRGQIRVLLAQLIACGTEVGIELSSRVISGEVAYVSELWTIAADGPGGSRYQRAVEPILVFHRIEGWWKLAIAEPWRTDRLRAEQTP